MKYMKNQNDQKLCKLSDQLDIERGNTEILKKRLAEQKKQFDGEIEGIKKEKSLRIDQLQTEII